MGTDHDTSAFAVATLRRWWRACGSARYPGARRLLICADSGGSNAARARAWKVELARLAAETGLQVTVCHYPPGTSKWNKVEHRLFAQITRNWRGRPLTSHQAVVELIGATTTSTGLTVTAELDTSEYATGLTYTKKQVEALPIDYHGFHGTGTTPSGRNLTKRLSLPGSRRHARGNLSYLFSIAKRSAHRRSGSSRAGASHRGSSAAPTGDTRSPPGSCRRPRSADWAPRRRLRERCGLSSRPT